MSAMSEEQKAVNAAAKAVQAAEFSKSLVTI